MTDQEKLDQILLCKDNPEYFIQTFLPTKLYKQQQFLLDCYTTSSTFAITSRQVGTTYVNTAYLLWNLIFGDSVDGKRKYVAYVTFSSDNAIYIKNEVLRLYKLLPDFLMNLSSSGRNTLCTNNCHLSFYGFNQNTFRGNSFSEILIDNIAHIKENLLENIFSIPRSTKLIISTSLSLNNYSVFSFIKNHGIDNTMNVQIIPFESCSQYSTEKKSMLINRLGQVLYDSEYSCIESGVTYA